MDSCNNNVVVLILCPYCTNECMKINIFLISVGKNCNENRKTSDFLDKIDFYDVFDIFDFFINRLKYVWHS